VQEFSTMLLEGISGCCEDCQGRMIEVIEAIDRRCDNLEE
jgi:hypothetical protein